jgi:hypothetical protein
MLNAVEARELRISKLKTRRADLQEKIFLLNNKRKEFMRSGGVGVQVSIMHREILNLGAESNSISRLLNRAGRSGAGSEKSYTSISQLRDRDAIIHRKDILRKEARAKEAEKQRQR